MTKTMTKTALIVFAAVLVLAAVCVAFACTGTANAAVLTENSNTQSVQVTYTVEGGWAVKITDGPITLTPDEEKTITVEVTKAVLSDGQTLSVEVTSANDYKLKHGELDELAYTVKKGGTTLSASEKTVLENIDGTTDLSANGKADLTVKLEQATASQAKYDGDYTDTLNFKVNVSGD